jgi:hypothetical protein
MLIAAAFDIQGNAQMLLIAAAFAIQGKAQLLLIAAAFEMQGKAQLFIAAAFDTGKSSIVDCRSHCQTGKSNICVDCRSL